MRPEKQLLLDEVKEKIDNSNGVIVARYRGLNAAASRALRNCVAPLKGEMEVVKKRVFAKALAASRHKMEVDHFEGDIALFFAYDDAVALSKAALKFGDDNGNAIELVTAIVDGVKLSGDEINQLAKLPSLPELRSQIVGVMAAPMQHLLALIAAYVESKSKGAEAAVEGAQTV